MIDDPETRALATQIEDEICGLYGQDAHWVHYLDDKRKEWLYRDLDRLLNHYRDLMSRLGHEYGEA